MFMGQCEGLGFKKEPLCPDIAQDPSNSTQQGKHLTLIPEESVFGRSFLKAQGTQDGALLALTCDTAHSDAWVCDDRGTS